MCGGLLKIRNECFGNNFMYILILLSNLSQSFDLSFIFLWIEVKDIFLDLLSSNPKSICLALYKILISETIVYIFSLIDAMKSWDTFQENLPLYFCFEIEYRVIKLELIQWIDSDVGWEYFLKGIFLEIFFPFFCIHNWKRK